MSVPDAANLYPLVFEPILKPKVWGGRRLAGLGKALPPSELIGESWELADLATTSAGGGGGGAEHSRIVNGSLAGHTLRDAIQLWQQRLLGGTRLSNEGGFPLLVKYLDAREHLSVQVHPSPEYARRHPSAHLKTECWFVVQAEPGSVIYKGLRPGVTHADVECALTRTPHGAGVVELLEQHTAHTGDLHHLPSGTLHALGAGVAVAEVQTPSDTTFRVYDWTHEYARQPRELHVTQALESLLIEAPPQASRLPVGAQQAELLRTPYFDIAQVQLTPGQRFDLPTEDADRPVVVMPINAAIRIEAGAATIDLQRGATALVPAACVRNARLHAEASASALLARPGSIGL